MLPRFFPTSRVALLSIVLLMPASAAIAQTSRPPARPPKSAPAQSSTWEVDVHGGGAFGSQPTGGTSALPPFGDAFTALNGKNTRSVSSWFFGNGSTLFNSSLTSGGIPAIVPIDSVLNSSSFERHRAGSIGGRVHYTRPGHRLGFETSIDVGSGGPRWTTAALAGIDASRASFQAAWTAVGMTTTAVKTVTDGSANDLTWTGGVTVDLMSRGQDKFFATGGIGTIHAMGDAPSLTLVGHYSIAALALDETDSVTLHAEKRNVFFFTVGAGWKRELTPRFGVRADLSAQIGPNNLTMQVDTAPKVVTTTVASQQAVFTLSATSATTTITLSNVPNATGNFQSSLRPLGVQQFATFSGDSVLTRVNFTAGIFMRF